MDESEKTRLMDQLDAAATEAMCQVGSLSYRAQFAVALEKTRQQDSALASGDTATVNNGSGDEGEGGGRHGLGEEGGEESHATDDEVVEPPPKKNENNAQEETETAEGKAYAEGKGYAEAFSKAEGPVSSEAQTAHESVVCPSLHLRSCSIKPAKTQQPIGSRM